MQVKTRFTQRLKHAPRVLAPVIGAQTATPVPAG
jgi:hypothetical protein